MYVINQITVYQALLMGLIVETGNGYLLFMNPEGDLCCATFSNKGDVGSINLNMTTGDFYQMVENMTAIEIDAIRANIGLNQTSIDKLSAHEVDAEMERRRSEALLNVERLFPDRIKEASLV